MDYCNFLQYNCRMTKIPNFRADRLKEEVERLGVKPGKLAEEIGVSYETLYKTLKGDIVQPPADTIMKLALLTKCSVEYFMGLTDKKEPTNLELSEVQQMLVSLIKTLPQWRQRDLLLVAQAYKEEGEPTRETMQKMLDMSEEVGGTELRHLIAAILNRFRPDGGDSGLAGGN